MALGCPVKLQAVPAYANSQNEEAFGVCHRLDFTLLTAIKGYTDVDDVSDWYSVGAVH